MKKNKLIPASEYCKSVFDGTHDTPKPCTEGHKLLTSKNILNGELDKSNAYYISEEDYNAINIRSKVHQDDILFSMIGSVGNVCLIKDNDSAIDFAIKNMGVFSCGEKEKAVFLYYYLQSPFAKKTIESYLNGAVQKFLGLECLRTFPVPEYSDDMKKIAAVLSALDDKIALNRRMNAKLEQLAKRLYDYWFVQFDFPNADGKPYKSSGGKMEYNEDLKREIPAGWEVKKLGEVLNLLKDGTHNPPKRIENGIALLTGTMFGDNFIDYSKATYISEEDYKTIHSTYEPQEGDIIITKIGTIGNVNFLRKNDLPLAIHCNSALLRFPSNIGSFFGFYFCKSDLFKQRMKAVKGQSIQEFVSLNRIESIPMEIPSNEIVTLFTTKVTPILNQQAKLQQESMKLSEMRDKLLPLLMNGQVEVK